jgi:ubiquinone/menaquinone biosynthesis C-methylase UbiE
MRNEKKKMKAFYNESVVYQKILSDLSHYRREKALERYAQVVREFAPGRMVLDLGCGTGETTRRLIAKGLQPIGVDISVMLLRTTTNETGSHQDFVSADISTLPFQTRTVDCVALHDVIEHIPDVENMLTEIIRVLRPHGRVIIVSPNLLSPIKPIRHIFGLEGLNINFYGSLTRAFLAVFGNILSNLNKTFSRRLQFNFRQPILDGFKCPDDDAVFLANYTDLQKWFQKRDFRVLYHQVSSDKESWIGRVKLGVLGFLPWLDKGFYLIAERRS